jgi:hypothetical protein
MNNKINELAITAGIHRRIDSQFEMWCWEYNLEKFANSIIDECVQVCNAHGEKHDGLYAAWAQDLSLRIKQHFENSK